MQRQYGPAAGTLAFGCALIAAALLSQAMPATAAWILPMLALAGLGLAWSDALRFDVPPDALEWALGCWLLLWLLSAAFALEPEHALGLSVPTLVFLLLFVPYRRGGEPLQRTILAALAALGTVQAVSLLVFSPGAAPPDRVLAAASPWLLVPNDAAWWLCLWPLWWRRACEGGAAWRPLWGSAMAVQFVALATLQSRLAALVLAVAGLTLWLGQRRRPHVGWLLVMALPAATLLLLAIGKGLASVQARMQLWQAAWSLWRSHPWLGVGPHGFGPAYRSVDVGAWIDARLTPWPHQLPLELLANTGGLGTAAFLAVGVIAFRRVLLESEAARRWKLAALLSFATISLLEASPLRMWWWVVLAVLLGGVRSDQSRTSG